MKTTLTRYIGKIIAVVRQEGFFGGIKRILKAFFVILRPIGKGDVLFISSGIVGNSWRFRVQNVAQELEFQGFSTSFAIQENPFLIKYVNNFSVFVFHLVNYTPQIKILIEKLKAAGKEIIFETDDLLFEKSLIKNQDFYRQSNDLLKKFYEKGVGSEFLDDPYVKVCTTTTTFLAEKLRAHNKKVFLVPNKLSKADIETTQSILEAKKLKPNKLKAIRLGYFSGALSHNKDFASISDALMIIMEKYPNVELLLAGPLAVESKLNKFSARIAHAPYVSREKHFANIASVDINLAPVEIDNPFCTAKSELKFFEAGILQVPTIATANQTFCQAIVDGVDGFVAKDTQQWVEKLEKLILDEKLRKAMGLQAREKALTKYSTEKASNQEYYNYLRSKISK